MFGIAAFGIATFGIQRDSWYKGVQKLQKWVTWPTRVTQFWPNFAFIRQYLSSISVPNLKFLASTVPEILGWSQNCKSGSRDPHNDPFWPNLAFCSLVPLVIHMHAKFEPFAMTDHVLQRRPIVRSHSLTAPAWPASTTSTRKRFSVSSLLTPTPAKQVHNSIKHYNILLHYQQAYSSNTLLVIGTGLVPLSSLTQTQHRRMCSEFLASQLR